MQTVQVHCTLYSTLHGTYLRVDSALWAHAKIEAAIYAGQPHSLLGDAKVHAKYACKQQSHCILVNEKNYRKCSVGGGGVQQGSL